MTFKSRMVSIFLIAVMLLGLVMIRQANSVLFIKIQDMNREQRVAQQLRNQSLIKYLEARRSVPKWAKDHGYIMKEHQT